MTKQKIPKDWQEVRLKEVYDVRDERTTKESNLAHLSLTIEKGLIKKPKQYNREHLVKSKDKEYKKVHYKDILYNPQNLRFGAVTQSKLKEVGLVSPIYEILKVKEDVCLSEILILILQSKNFRNLYDRFSEGTLRERQAVSKEDFSDFKLTIPKSKKEQEKIAKILSCVDNVIDRTQEIIEGYERVKSGLMDELLVKGIGHKEFKKVKLENREIEIPESWEFRELGEIFEILKSYGISRKHLSEKNEIKCFHYGDIHNFKKLFFDVGTEKISNCNYDFFGQKEIEFLKEGDVVLVDASEDNIDIGKTISIKNIGDFKCVAGLHTFLLRRKLKNIYIDYSVFLLNNKIIKAEMGKISTGISVYGISKTNLKKLTSFIPPLPEQKTISKILQTQDNLIQLEKQSLTKLKQIKKGLMQKLLTGKTRVKI